MGQKSYPRQPGAGHTRHALLSSTSWSAMAQRSARAMAALVPALIWYGALDSTPAAAQSTTPPPSNSFCGQEGEGIETCGGPTTAPATDISSSLQRQIEQRLEQLRCVNSNDPACVKQGGASEDSPSLNGFSWFVSGEYQHKDRTQTDFALGYDQDTAGGTAGVDYRLGTWGVIGGAFNYRHDFGDYKHEFGSFDQDTENFIIYGSYFPTDQSFIDLSLGFANKDFSDTHINTGFAAG